MLENIKKCEFDNNSLVYLGNVISECELNIDLVKI